MQFVCPSWHLTLAVCHMMPFMYHTRFPKTFPIVQRFFAELRAGEGATLPVGAAGFCWGGKHVFLLANTSAAGNTMDLADGGISRPLIDAGFTGHPSRLSFPADIEAATVPMSVAVGDKDNQLPAPRAEAVRALLETKLGAERGELRMYEGATHGFAVRAELKENKEMMRQAAEAEDQCIAWFQAKLMKS
jgi:dienelactone hydrolase